MKGIEKIQSVSDITILLNLQIFKFLGSFDKEKNLSKKLSKLEYYPLSGKVNFSAIYLLILPFTVFEEYYSAQRFCKLSEKVTF